MGGGSGVFVGGRRGDPAARGCAAGLAGRLTFCFCFLITYAFSGSVFLSTLPIFYTTPRPHQLFLITNLEVGAAQPPVFFGVFIIMTRPKLIPSLCASGFFGGAGMIWGIHHFLGAARTPYFWHNASLCLRLATSQRLL